MDADVEKLVERLQKECVWPKWTRHSGEPRQDGDPAHVLVGDVRLLLKLLSRAPQAPEDAEIERLRAEVAHEFERAERWMIEATTQKARVAKLEAADERVREAMFILSDRLRASGALNNDAVHAAYESVVAALSPTDEPAGEGR